MDVAQPAGGVTTGSAPLTIPGVSTPTRIWLLFWLALLLALLGAIMLLRPQWLL